MPLHVWLDNMIYNFGDGIALCEMARMVDLE